MDWHVVSQNNNVGRYATGDYISKQSPKAIRLGHIKHVKKKSLSIISEVQRINSFKALAFTISAT